MHSTCTCIHVHVRVNEMATQKELQGFQSKALFSAATLYMYCTYTTSVSNQGLHHSPKRRIVFRPNPLADASRTRRHLPDTLPSERVAGEMQTPAGRPHPYAPVREVGRDGQVTPRSHAKHTHSGPPWVDRGRTLQSHFQRDFQCAVEHKGRADVHHLLGVAQGDGKDQSNGRPVAGQFRVAIAG